MLTIPRGLYRDDRRASPPACTLTGGRRGGYFGAGPGMLDRAAQARTAEARGERLHWMRDATHVGLYDTDEYVTDAVAQLDEFFSPTLAMTAATA